MDQKPLIILLADISGYTRFMLETQTSAVHGQWAINGLIEALLEQVDIPLTLQEIEGDAVFLYAAHPGSDARWNAVVEEVSHKLAAFFRAFIAQAGVLAESTPCKCAICANADKLGLKIIVHAGEAVFHQIAGRPQVSGTDVILAHRLLKNTVASNEYLLLSEAAWAAMGAHLPGTFERHRESYEGFGDVDVRVRDLSGDFLTARDNVYALGDAALGAAVDNHMKTLRPGAILAAAFQQLRNPIRPFRWWEKLAILIESTVGMSLAHLTFRRTIPRQIRARGHRRS